VKYFIATILSKGKKEQLPVYAQDRKEAHEYLKIKTTPKPPHHQNPFQLQYSRPFPT